MDDEIEDEKVSYFDGEKFLFLFFWPKILFGYKMVYKSKLDEVKIAILLLPLHEKVKQCLLNSVIFTITSIKIKTNFG